ncbi:MAG: P1 family peptidase [Candidatus Hodarchaeota archaeon]
MISTERKRARDLGLVIGSLPPGPQNAISDVPGVRVGHATLIQGDGPLIPGKGPVRTGVTAILPHDENLYTQPVVGTVHVINGFGKAVGLAQLLELGRIETPILLTSTLNVGLVEDAVTQYMVEQNPQAGITGPTPNAVVAECHDGYLNDAQGRHVRKPHVYAAIQSASPTVEEGCVGAGTGLMAFGYKSGIGTASRILPKTLGAFVIGCLAIPNFGRRGDLILNGIPSSQIFDSLNTQTPDPTLRPEGGSIVVVLATNAPLTSRQLLRLARRAVIGIGRTGSVVSHGSGDFVIAFSTAFRDSTTNEELLVQRMQIRESKLTAFFGAVVEVTEEAILNGLTMAVPMIGRDNHEVDAVPSERIARFFER